MDIPDDGKLARNILHFARALRAAGLRIGPDRVLNAVRAVAATGFGEKQDFYAALAANFVSRPEDRRVFAQVFRLYWRDPRYLEHMMAMMLPSVRGVQEDRRAAPAERRAAEGLMDGTTRPEPQREDQQSEEVLIDASGTASGTERLKALDFEQMTAAEVAEAHRLIARIRLPVPQLVSRRMALSHRGALYDGPRSLRRAMRTGGEMRDLVRRARGSRPPDLVALCDISGSMSRYSRAVLHFLHAVSNRRGSGWGRVHAFTFGTRLTNITRHLGTRDVDAALAAAGAQAQDWEGGTRIAHCLGAFNRDWSRRVLGQGAAVLLITDGLEREPGPELAREAERLGLTARRLVWVNPLLRWDGFAPRAAGIQAMLPHVHSLRPGHSIHTLEGLAASLGAREDGGALRRLKQRGAEHGT